MEARRQKGRDVGDAVWNSVKRPNGYSLSQWRSRRPTQYDVDALDMKANRFLDPVTEGPLFQECRRKAARGELTKSDYYNLATLLFGNPDIAKWINSQGREEYSA